MTLEEIAGAVHAALDKPDLALTRCILATRVLIEAASAFGFAARPEVVSVLAANRPAYDLIRQGVLPADWPPQAWSVGVVAGVPGRDRNGFDGHLVAVVDGFLVDCATGQFARPERGLDVADAPVVMPIPDGWYEHRAPLTVTCGYGEDWVSVLEYEKGRVPVEFRHAPDWKHRYRSYAGEAIRSLRGAL